MDGTEFKQYIPLTEYAIKYKVSISTLRRRIKSEEIDFQFHEGKYLISDKPLSYHANGPRPSPNKSEMVQLGAQASATVKERAPEFFPGSEGPALSSVTPPDSAPVINEANRLLVELKRAYTKVLQEKEEQILELKEEVTDLKTLVKVLESELEREQAKSRSRQLLSDLRPDL